MRRINKPDKKFWLANLSVINDKILLNIKCSDSGFLYWDFSKENFQELIKFHEESSKIYKLFGTSKIYFIKGDWLQNHIVDYAWEHPWQDLTEYIETKTYFMENPHYKPRTKKRREKLAEDMAAEKIVFLGDLRARKVSLKKFPEIMIEDFSI